MNARRLRSIAQKPAVDFWSADKPGIVRPLKGLGCCALPQSSNESRPDVACIFQRHVVDPAAVRPPCGRADCRCSVMTPICLQVQQAGELPPSLHQVHTMIKGWTPADHGNAAYICGAVVYMQAEDHICQDSLTALLTWQDSIMRLAR